MNKFMSTAAVAATTFGVVQTVQAQSGIGASQNEPTTTVMHNEANIRHNDAAHTSLSSVKEVSANGQTHEKFTLHRDNDETNETVDVVQNTDGKTYDVTINEAGATAMLGKGPHEVTKATVTAAQFAASKEEMYKSFGQGRLHAVFPVAAAPSL